MVTAMDDKRDLQPPTDGAQLATYDFDLDSGVLVWGGGLFALFGFDRAMPVNSHAWWSSRIHPDDAMVLNETMDMLMYPWVKEWTVDYRFQKGDNSYVLVHDRATVVRDANGKATRLNGVLWLAETERTPKS